MKNKFTSLKPQLVMVLLCITLLPSIIVAWVSFDLMSSNIRSNRIDDVGIVADAKRDQLVRALTMQNSMAKSFLKHLAEWLSIRPDITRS
jgi:hypothetical protein